MALYQRFSKFSFFLIENDVPTTISTEYPISVENADNFHFIMIFESVYKSFF